MDQNLLFEIITAIVAILGLGKIFYEISSRNKATLRDEYLFSKDFLNDLAQEIKPHPFSIEKGYQAIAGTSKITSKEVSYLLSLENSCQCVRDYVFSREYLEYIDAKQKSEIVFLKKYNSKTQRLVYKSIYISSYFIFAFLALSPFLFPGFFGFNLYNSIKNCLFTFPFFGYFAFTSIQFFAKLMRSEKLINNQKNYTKISISK